MGYKFKAISGFTWRQVFYLANNLIAIGRMAVLARLLTPYDFGLFSITAIALGLSEAFTQTGVNLTILQSKKKINFFLDTAWVISIFRGFFIALLMLCLAWLLPKIYHEAGLVKLVVLASFVPSIKGFINPMIVSLQKNLHFSKNTYYHLSRVVVETVVAILLALYLHDATAFIWGMIAGAFFEVIISFIYFKPRPKFKYQAVVSRLIFKNAKGLTPMAALNYVYENVDNLIIGKVLGATNLGYYQNAYALSHKANYQLAQAANHGLLPIFAKIEQDKKRVKQAFFKAVSIMALVMLGASLVLVLWPEPIIRILLGDQWLASVPLMPILTLAGWLQGFSILIYTFFLAKAKFRPINLHLVATVSLLILFVWYGSVANGLVGASWGVVASRALTLPILGYFLYQEVKNT